MSLLFGTPGNVPSNSLPHHTCEIPDTKRLNSFLLEPAKGYVLQKRGTRSLECGGLLLSQLINKH